jgi:hypothetical protein
MGWTVPRGIEQRFPHGLRAHEDRLGFIDELRRRTPPGAERELAQDVRAERVDGPNAREVDTISVTTAAGRAECVAEFGFQLRCRLVRECDRRELVDADRR